MLSFSEIIRLSLVDFCSDMLQAVERFIKRFGFLGEMEADQVVDVLAEETGTRNSADADVSRQHLTKFEVAFVTKFRNIEQDIISTLRHGMRDADIVQALQKQVTLFGVFVSELSVIIVAEAQSGHRRLLQGSRRTDGQKVVNLFCNVDNLRRSDDISQTPSRNRIGF